MEPTDLGVVPAAGSARVVLTGAGASRPRIAKGFLARSIALTVALLIAVSLSELLTRLVRPQATMFPRYVTSPDYAYEFAPNVSIRNSRGNRWAFTYTTNAIGRRGPFVRPEEHGVPRVVLLGDSYTFGFGVDDQDVYSSQLQNLVGHAWRVVNGGMAGWGIDSEIKWYFQTGRHYQPRAVVLQFCGNDPWDSNTGVTTVADGRFTFHRVPVSSQKPAWMDWVSRSAILQRSHLYSLIRSYAEGGPGDFNRRVLDSGNAGDPVTAGSTGRTHEELQYLEYLRTFAARLNEERIPFLFLSTTHNAPSGYAYDVAMFPQIDAGVHRLEEEGLLRFVALPLSDMQKYPESPEGHHWGSTHHRRVAEALAAALSKP